MGELVSFEGQRARRGAAIGFPECAPELAVLRHASAHSGKPIAAPALIRYSAARDLPKIDFTEGLIATFMAE